MSESIYGLPDGRNLSMGTAQAAAVWAWWRSIARTALQRGEGVAVAVEGDTVEISTVYAPRWEGVRVVVGPDGQAEWCSEQSAPSITPSAEPPPWGPR